MMMINTIINDDIHGFMAIQLAYHPSHVWPGSRDPALGAHLRHDTVQFNRLIVGKMVGKPMP
jgi:hypothetical protein